MPKSVFQHLPKWINFSKERKRICEFRYSYAASTQGHIGALMGMGYRHMEGYGVPQSCTTAALNYVEVAKQITAIYSAGMPQAVELIRLNLDTKDKKAMSNSEISLFMLIASSGDTGAAAAIGRRYLLGIDGFRQNYKKALQFLKIAADSNHGGALALIGYMYCLGLGVQKNLDIAYSLRKIKFMFRSLSKAILELVLGSIRNFISQN
jgi:TPR repeat protein